MTFHLSIFQLNAILLSYIQSERRGRKRAGRVREIRYPIIWEMRKGPRAHWPREEKTPENDLGVHKQKEQ